MLNERRVLAVVPARAGSKGIPDKNLAVVAGRSLIAHAGEVLRACPWVDAAVISTDSDAYAEEGLAHGLRAPFLRPDELSGDDARAIDAIAHALTEMERIDGVPYDVVLIVEPTSPIRRPEDLLGCARTLLDAGADAVITVSELPAKSHPHKVFLLEEGRLRFYEACGADVVNRQELAPLYWRNGVCYALTRACVLEQRAVVTDDTVPYLVRHETANIDEPIDVLWAEFLMSRFQHPGDAERG